MPNNRVATKSFHIAREAAGHDSAKLTSARLAGEIAANHGPRGEEAFALAARDDQGGWIGGVNGVIHWRWLYVSQFYMSPDWRGRGIGRALLAEVEVFARDKDCVGIYIDTFNERTLAFYRRCGFAVAGRIENFPPGAARTFLNKAL